MTPVRLACVRYLNAVPLIEGLAKAQGVRLDVAPPAEIASRLLADQADLGLASVIDAAHASGRLALVPVGMIGCNGPTLTVRLFSRVEPAAICRLHADPESHTSTVLCQLLIEQERGTRPEVVALDAASLAAARAEADHAPEALLLIGDKTVTHAPPRHRYPHQLDLGQLWHARTGLPFVYAVWMCRADRAADPVVRLAIDLLDRQRRRNAFRTGWIAATHAARHGWEARTARRYLTRTLIYDVDAAARTAVSQFLTMAAQAGLAPDPAPSWIALETGSAAAVN